MKRYWLFAGSVYYALGGMNDFIGWFETIDEALAEVKRIDEEWYQIMDITIPQVVQRSDRRPHGADYWNEDNLPPIAKCP